MDIKDARKYIRECKVDLSEFFGEGEYVTLREPNIIEFNEMREGLSSESEGNNQIETFISNFTPIFSTFIVDHSFTANSKKATNEAVADIVSAKIQAFTAVVTEYMSMLFIEGKEDSAD